MTAPFVLTSLQNNLFDCFLVFDRIIYSKERQVGFTTIALLFAITEAVANPHKKIIICCFNMRMAKHSVETLQNLCKKESISYSVSPTSNLNIVLDNGSEIKFATADHINIPDFTDPVDVFIGDEISFYNNFSRLVALSVRAKKNNNWWHKN